jgi:hypothetical protein
VRTGTMVSIANFCLRSPMRSPSIKPRSTNQHFDEAFVYGAHHLFDQFIENGAFMPPAGNHAGHHEEKGIKLTVDVEQAHQLVAAALLVTQAAETDLFSFHRVVVSSNQSKSDCS